MLWVTPAGSDRTIHQEHDMRKMATIVLFCTLLSLPATVYAGIEPVPWRLPATQGFDNPVFWVLFNPQPEPPGEWMHVDATDPYALVFTVRNDAAGVFGLAFKIDNATSPLSYRGDIAADSIGFWIDQATGLAFHATFTFSGLSLPGSDVMFNPQPEPPGLPDALGWATFSLRDQTGAPLPLGMEVDMTLRLYDGDGDPVALQSVPEPATIMLLGLGLIGLLGICVSHEK
jgi:hypothetical protein